MIVTKCDNLTRRAATDLRAAAILLDGGDNLREAQGYVLDALADLTVAAEVIATGERAIAGCDAATLAAAIRAQAAAACNRWAPHVAAMPAGVA